MKDSPYSKVEAFRYFILATQRQGNRILNESLKHIGLTTSQAEVIGILEEWESLSLKGLGELLICESGSPSRLIERMCQEALIEKIIDPIDSRYVVLQLTHLGLEKAKAIKEIEIELYKQMMQSFSEDELESVSTLLMRFLKDQPIVEAFKKRNLW